jgi:hypothetical protein
MPSGNNPLKHMSFLDDLYRQHGNQVQERVSSELGIDPRKAAAALPQVAPIVLAGLKRRMEQHGPEQIEREAQEMTGGADPDDIGALLNQGSSQAASDPGLTGLFGGKGEAASQMVANQLGISPAAAAKLLPMLAPLIIGMLMKKGRTAGGQNGRGGEGSGGGGLASILDQNGDGSIMDDLGRIVSGGAGKSGCLGSLLGGLMKGRR